MNFEQQETDLVNQVVFYINDTSIEVRTTPETQKEFDDQRLKDKPIINICYQGSDYERSRTVDIIAQAETEIFDVVVRSVKLRGQKGIYALMDLARRALVGFKLSGCKPIYLLDFKPDERSTEQEWVWKMRFAFETSFAQVDNSQPVALLQQVSFNDLNNING